MVLFWQALAAQLGVRFPLHLDWRSALGWASRVKAAYSHRFFALNKIDLALMRIDRPIRSAGRGGGEYALEYGAGLFGWRAEPALGFSGKWMFDHRFL